LHEFFAADFKHDKRLQREVQRIKNERLFLFQRLSTILHSSMREIVRFGRIFSENEENQFLDHCKDPAYMSDLYERHFSPDVTGELLVTPE
jgi:hypothetical protein